METHVLRAGLPSPERAHLLQHSVAAAAAEESASPRTSHFTRLKIILCF
jgi:hypothetical protein